MVWTAGDFHETPGLPECQKCFQSSDASCCFLPTRHLACQNDKHVFGNLAMRPHGLFSHARPLEGSADTCFVIIFRLTTRPHQRVYSYAIRNRFWSVVIPEKSWKSKTFDPPKQNNILVNVKYSKMFLKPIEGITKLLFFPG